MDMDRNFYNNTFFINDNIIDTVTIMANKDDFNLKDYNNLINNCFCNIKKEVKERILNTTGNNIFFLKVNLNNKEVIITVKAKNLCRLFVDV